VTVPALALDIVGTQNGVGPDDAVARTMLLRLLLILEEQWLGGVAVPRHSAGCQEREQHVSDHPHGILRCGVAYSSARDGETMWDAAPEAASPPGGESARCIAPISAAVSSAKQISQMIDDGRNFP